jgi:iron(III) transport system ATP-binding protein
MIIGFNSIEGGEIRIDGKRINDVPTNKRNMGMVFQNYAIFPHMSVKDNVGFGLKNRKMPKEQAEKEIDEILKIVKIDHLKDRMPSRLSGGQQQRVALARAIVIHPEVLLMDEPLSNLDAKLRVEMRNAIKRIQQQIGITTVYVTHDQEEALAVSDRIAVMNDGIIQQIDTPKNVYQRPSNLFVSTFIGLSNIMDGTRTADGIRIGDYSVTMDNLDSSVPASTPVKVSIRPEEFVILKDQTTGIPVTVKSSVFLGVTTHYFVTAGNGQEMEIIQNSDMWDVIPDGTDIRLGVQADKINVFNADGSESLIVRRDRS